MINEKGALTALLSGLRDGDGDGDAKIAGVDQRSSSLLQLIAGPIMSWFLH